MTHSSLIAVAASDQQLLSGLFYRLIKKVLIQYNILLFFIDAFGNLALMFFVCSCYYCKFGICPLFMTAGDFDNVILYEGIPQGKRPSQRFT